jgi:hypothetical protein
MLICRVPMSIEPSWTALRSRRQAPTRHVTWGQLPLPQSIPESAVVPTGNNELIFSPDDAVVRPTKNVIAET